MILVVEDCAALRRAVLRYLTRAGFTAFAVVDVASAIKELNGDADIRVVVTDWDLGNGTGADVIAVARTAHWGRGVPCVVHSSLDRSGEPGAEHAVAHVLKGDPRALVDTVRRVLTR